MSLSLMLCWTSMHLSHQMLYSSPNNSYGIVLRFTERGLAYGNWLFSNLKHLTTTKFINAYNVDVDWVLCYFLLCLCSVYTGTSYTCMYFIARRKECERIYVFYTAVNIAIYKEVPKWKWTKIINVSISNVNETADGVNYWIDKYIKLLIKLKPI